MYAGGVCPFTFSIPTYMLCIDSRKCLLGYRINREHISEITRFYVQNINELLDWMRIKRVAVVDTNNIYIHIA